MKSKFNTIEEQVKRMKSLFTDKILYGNIIEEGCDASTCSKDEIVDIIIPNLTTKQMSDALEAKGWITSEPGSEATESVRDSYLRCLKTDTGNDSFYGNIYKGIKRYENDIEISPDLLKDGKCVLKLSPDQVRPGYDNIRAAIWNDAGWKLHVYYDFGKLSDSLLGSVERPVKYVAYKADMIDPYNYINLKFNGWYMANFIRIPGSTSSVARNLDVPNYEDSAGVGVKYGSILFENTSIASTGLINNVAANIKTMKADGASSTLKFKRV